MTQLDEQIEEHKKEIHSDSYPMSIEKNVTLLMDIFKKNIIDSAAYANVFHNGGKRHTCLKLMG
jgi:hypothetical protein